MAVSITLRPGKPRGNRGIGFDKQVRAIAASLIDAQRQGHINSRQVAAYFADEGITSPSGKSWTETTIFRMLRRAPELGFSIIRYNRPEAASRRKVLRRSNEQIEMDRRRMFTRIKDTIGRASEEVETSPTMTLLQLARK